jgi:5-methylthioadenosine/S-adenosylhomocysteine deaminase
MDLMDEMWLATLIHKGRNLNPTLVPADQVLAMATIDGARCLAWDDEIGSLVSGKKADLIILDPRRPGSYPLYDPVGGVVNAMHASNVEASMCNGRWLMRGGRVLALDEDAILKEAQSRAFAIRARAGITLPPR